jgi:uncharacterized protein
MVGAMSSPTDPAPPIAPDLLHRDGGGVTLIAGRHRASGRLVFPLPPGPDWVAEDLPRRGTLWSWTVQRFRPKSPPYAGPEVFAPYAVGYVDLGPLIVEGRLTDVAFDALRIGQPMQVTGLEVALSDPPRRATTYAFAPVPEGESR